MFRYLYWALLASGLFSPVASDENLSTSQEQPNFVQRIEIDVPSNHSKTAQKQSKQKKNNTNSNMQAIRDVLPINDNLLADQIPQRTANSSEVSPKPSSLQPAVK